jgi:uncharacterized protein YdeI (YjbR/CyaY-like superfamily)
MKKDKRIDTYIAKAEPFARPILKHIRSLIHQTCPDVVETMKWSMPAFEYKGPLIGLAAFKKHAVMGFWKAQLMSDPVLVENARSESAMGHLGKLTSLKDLPPDKTIIKWIEEAMMLNEQGIKLPPKKKTVKKDVVVPDYVKQALKQNKKAAAVFVNFSPSHKREYIEWITDAKQDATRERRINTMLEWLGEGKSRNWKYEKKG